MKPIPIELKLDNYIIRVSGKLAWAEYDQYITPNGGDPKDRSFTRQYRVLVKEHGKWKIANLLEHDPESFDATPKNIERSINNIGQTLIRTDKLKEAIAVLRVNVRLNPDSADCHASLGEAFALDGNKPEAIENYEKAIALDPKSESSKAALAKLKE
jgi:tetratricopeptide (TPR) repeat protein